MGGFGLGAIRRNIVAIFSQRSFGERIRHWNRGQRIPFSILNSQKLLGHEICSSLTVGLRLLAWYFPYECRCSKVAEHEFLKFCGPKDIVGLDVLVDDLKRVEDSQTSLYIPLKPVDLTESRY